MKRNRDKNTPMTPSAACMQARTVKSSHCQWSAIRMLTLCLFIAAWPLTACKRAPLPPPVVLFDQGHGQHFLVGNQGELDLSKLGAIFVGQGFQVKTTEANQTLTDDTLAKVSTLVISGAFKPITDEEIVVIKKFIDRGGQLCAMLHIGTPLARLINELRMAVSNGVIREQNNLLKPESPTDFFVTDLAPHPVTKGLSQINFYGAWALDTELPANVLAKTTSSAWVDLNNDKNQDPGDASQAFSVVVTGQLGHGHFILFGDDAVFQNRFLEGPNLQLATNLASWFKEGSNY